MIDRIGQAKQWIVENIGSENLIILMSGAIGAVVALFHRKGVTLKDAIIRVFVGAVTAVFSAILADHLFDLSMPMGGFVGFVAGMVGMEITGAIINIASKFQEEGWDVLKKWISKK
jgi:CHASE2 domain-containing sensor protein